jgi:hypothetical protein
MDGQLTHDGVGGERSDLGDLRPAVMAARGPGCCDDACQPAPVGGSAIMRVLKEQPRYDLRTAPRSAGIVAPEPDDRRAAQ